MYITSEAPAQGSPPGRETLTAVDPAGALVAFDDGDGDGLFLSVPAQTVNPCGLVTRAPRTPYTFTIELLHQAPSSNSSPIGILARESASGKLKTYGVQGGQLVASKYTGSGVDSTYGTLQLLLAPVLWLRWADDGTTVLMRSSPDGLHWRTDFTESRTDWCTPDQIGVCISANQDDVPTFMLVRNWSLT
jgi:hypothetical protein